MRKLSILLILVILNISVGLAAQTKIKTLRISSSSDNTPQVIFIAMRGA
jgi:hypothetical protein